MPKLREGDGSSIAIVMRGRVCGELLKAFSFSPILASWNKASIWKIGGSLGDKRVNNGLEDKMGVD